MLPRLRDLDQEVAPPLHEGTRARLFLLWQKVRGKDQSETSRPLGALLTTRFFPDILGSSIAPGPH